MGFFNYAKPGKGISKEDVEKTGVALYFDLFFRKWGNIIKLNLLYILLSIPAIVISFVIGSYLMSAIVDFTGLERTENIYTYMLVLSVPFTVMIFQATGSGPASIAMNSITCKYIKDTHAWLWSDFMENLKSNFKQGIIMYLVNTFVFFFCAFAFLFYNYVMGGAMGSFLKTLIMIISIMFFIMQLYAYRIAAEFKLKTKHVYTNALILSFVGLKWTALAAVVIGVIMYLTYTLMSEFFVIGTAFIVVIYFALLTFTQNFITNNVVKKYLLEPSLKQQNEQENNE